MYLTNTSDPGVAAPAFLTILPFRYAKSRWPLSSVYDVVKSAPSESARVILVILLTSAFVKFRLPEPSGVIVSVTSVSVLVLTDPALLFT